ncbi:MAG TPA: XylR family transcriptional regulator [Verrucomicrobiae bacterium]|nr:XylR family transcriptional regulator [Verrucomicrobiae bacterium]
MPKKPRRQAHDSRTRAHVQERPKRVILIYDPMRASDMKITQGIADFARAQSAWQLFFHEGKCANKQPPDFEGWPADGVICSCHILKATNGTGHWGVPLVAFGGTWTGNPSCDRCVHCVAADHAAVGRMGADHFLQRGFRHMAFCGYCSEEDQAWSAPRAEAFAHRAAEANVPCQTFSPNGAAEPWPTIHRTLADWIRILPRPVGLMAANDRRARQVLEACHHLGVKVPEDVAIVGADDDPLVCELCQPTLSSIDQSGRQIGRDTAALLDALMRGEQPPPGVRIVPPAGITERRSSDIIAVQDNLASAALAHVRAHACEGIKIADVASALDISRSTLQTRFKYAVGRTIHDEIRRVRLETARRLLSALDLPIKQVADRSGFRTVQHMTAVFRQFLGTTPAAFREEARARRGRGT